MTSEVFNNSIGSPYSFNFPQFTEQEVNELLAGLFEQLLIFDRIILSTNRQSVGLSILLHKLGINTVERLIESGYLKFMIWSPVVVTGSGRQRDDGTIDESVIYGQPPIASGALSDEDSDPENNIKVALNRFNIHPERKKSFLLKARKVYIVPNGMEFSSDSARFVIDAYKNNNLATLGLPFEKEPNQLNLAERYSLLGLSHKVIETALIAKYGLKSYNREHVEISDQNLKKIGKAYNVVDNTTAILKLRNLPDLKTLYLLNRVDFDLVFKIRHYSTAKYFRNWINSVGENSNAEEIKDEYFKEIHGNHKFFNTKEGKLARNLTVFGIGTGLAEVLNKGAGIAAGFTLGLLDQFWLDSILIGKNPSMFIEELKKEIESREDSK